MMLSTSAAGRAAAVALPDALHRTAERRTCGSPAWRPRCVACLEHRQNPPGPARRSACSALQLMATARLARRHREDDAGGEACGGGEPAAADARAVHCVVKMGRRERADAQEGPHLSRFRSAAAAQATVWQWSCRCEARAEEKHGVPDRCLTPHGCSRAATAAERWCSSTRSTRWPRSALATTTRWRAGWRPCRCEGPV